MTGACFLAAGIAGAQDNPNDGDATSGFNIPADVKLLGKMDPNSRHATAKVNGAIITGTDVDQRVALVLDASKGTTISADEMQALRLQVLRNLIDETLEIQQAKAEDVEAKPEEVEQDYVRVAQQKFNEPPEALDKYLRSIGSSPASLKRQIEGEVALNNLTQRNISPFVNISDSEVQEVYNRIQASKGTSEYQIAEIYLSDTPQTRDAVLQNAKPDRIEGVLRTDTAP